MRSKNLFPLSVCLFLCLVAVSQQPPQSSMKIVQQNQLCVTEGEITQASDNTLAISAPKVRAFVTNPTLQEVEARFRYLGPSEKSIPLASGQMRRQFGLKLRAQDGCNLVYAMWRIVPTPELVVSVKSNPGMNRSSDCDAHGYHNIKPKRTGHLPAIKRGRNYTLRAIMDHTTMRVYADNNLVWEGDLGPGAARFDGPVGLRADNGRFEFELFAAQPGPGQQGATATCTRGEED